MVSVVEDRILMLLQLQLFRFVEFCTLLRRWESFGMFIMKLHNLSCQALHPQVPPSPSPLHLYLLFLPLLLVVFLSLPPPAPSPASVSHHWEAIVTFLLFTEA